MKSFLYHYIRSMRLYYGFVTMTTALLGVSFVHTPLADVPFFFGKTIIVLAIAFLAWGVNQIFSDYFDRKEDAINAPHRPMVTGALKPKPALTLSAVLMLLIGVGSFMLSPYAFLFLVIGGLLNIAYSLLKRVPILNCIVYACAISCCFPFAYAGVANRCPDISFPIGMATGMVLFVFPAHFLMCHNSYYKDVEGDRAAGVRTLQTLFSPVVARGFSWIVGGLFWLFHVFIVFGVAIATEHPLGDEKRQLFLLLFFQLGLEAMLFLCFMREIRQHNFHCATRLNCQWCVAMMYILLIPYPTHIWLFPVLEAFSLLAIQLLFRWYLDEKE